MARMLEYEWGGSPSTIILPTPGEEPPPHHHQYPDNSQADHPDRHHYFHPFNPQEGLVPAATTFYQQQPVNNAFYDPRAYVAGPAPFNHQLSAPPLPANSSSPSGYFAIPNAKGQGQTAGSRIGLNLGRRTYFSSAEDDFVNRLHGRRSRPVMADQAAPARCQAEGCNADLTLVKQYHRRHKVCEFHSKASTVIAHGLTQRFCQQCSRFHLLSEFDNGKRSCRKRLADHNRRRRRKSNSQSSGTANHQDISRHSHKSPTHHQPNSARNSPSEHLTGCGFNHVRSPPDTGVHWP